MPPRIALSASALFGKARSSDCSATAIRLRMVRLRGDEMTEKKSDAASSLNLTASRIYYTGSRANQRVPVFSSQSLPQPHQPWRIRLVWLIQLPVPGSCAPQSIRLLETPLPASQRSHHGANATAL